MHISVAVHLNQNGKLNFNANDGRILPWGGFSFGKEIQKAGPGGFFLHSHYE